MKCKNCDHSQESHDLDEPKGAGCVAVVHKLGQEMFCPCPAFTPEEPVKLGEFYVEQLVECDKCEADGKVTNRDIQSLQYRMRSYCGVCHGTKQRFVRVELGQAFEAHRAKRGETK